MKISTRLSATSSIIASSIFVIFGVTVYLFSSYYRKYDFQERLKERVVITEKIFLEKESFSPSELEKINDQFLHTLPEETEEVLLIQNEVLPIFEYNYPDEIKSEFIAQKTFNFEYSDIQGVSRIFQVKGKNYLVIVTAVDTIGLQNLSFLKNIIILLVLIGIPLIFIGSFVITKRALLPISKKINNANKISASNLHQRLRVYNPDDEIGKMAIAFNHLLDRLEESFDSQKSFISNASHEIKNPLTAIMGEAEIAMSKTRSNEEYLESLSIILKEAETLSATVNNLLQLSKVAANEENIKFETIQFDDFLNEIKRSYDFINPANKITLSIAHVKERQLFLILGNKNLLSTAILNLFDNACKFSSNGKVQVMLSISENQVILLIKDKGIGIDEIDIGKIMTPFYRGGNALKITGSGIGLSLSSKIMSIHHGTLEIKSKINVGTDVYVKLPIAEVIKE
ncbi:MAG: HAMP domain-containing histidine kinase [Cyclobacteriaceae bacterium]|nr:HAMP domain-containing histidine kinase [Cyclobacteriaceae bacterium]